MAPSQKETLLDWLRDAHAMENALVGMLETQAKRVEAHAGMKQKIEEHVQTTRRQKERLEGVIKKLGGNPSTVKDVTFWFAGNMQNLVPGAAPDSVVKIALANHGIENFEIACYTSLVAAAKEIGEQEVARVCQEILDEEKEMANYLAHHIPRLTTEYLQKTAAKA